MEILLGEHCELVFEEYPRIVYPRPENLFVDCGCNNYQNVLHSYGLTFWDDAGTIADSLRNEEIFAATEDIKKWNGFCIWRRYDNLKDGFDDTASSPGPF